MERFDLNQILANRRAQDRPWLEFLRTASLSMGVYCLKAGEIDQQQPHSEDEIYYVIAGKAWFRSAGKEQAVGPGTLLYVERSLEHHFHDITEDLTVLVFFAPPEGSLAKTK